ncbi:MAG: precorrin-2 C(20)-methyltransferase, partial [Candidatus Nanoarchaeia archaeon]
EGKAVAQITIGDPMLYSTSAYLLPLVLERLPEDYVHIVPGISAFQAAASIFLQPLTIQNDRFMLMPATDLNDVERALAQCETLVLYKCANVIDQLVKLLKKHGLINRAKMVCYAEQPDRQVVYRSIADLSKDNFGYMATVLIYIGRRSWNHEKD